jgi:hypothetical protein
VPVGTLTASVTINANFADINTNTNTMDSFKATFKTGVAGLLSGVDASQVVVNSVAAGSVVVDFSVLPNTAGNVIAASAITAAFTSGVTIGAYTTTAAITTTVETGAAPAVNCVGAYGACSATCGAGTQAYAISIAAANGGTQCAVSNGLTQVCNVATCPLPVPPAPPPSASNAAALVARLTYAVLCLAVALLLA